MRPQAARVSPGQGAPQGRPPLLRSGGPAAGFLRLVRAVNGAPTRRLPLPHAAACRGRGREKPGLLRLGKYVQEAGTAAGRPGFARAGRPCGTPPAAAQRGPAAGFLRLVRAVNGAPTRRLPLPPRGCLPGAGPSPREVQGNLQMRRFSCKSSAVIQFSGIFPAGRPKTTAKTQDKFFRLAFFVPKDLIFRPHFAMIKGNTLSKRGTGHDTGPASADQR